MAGHVVQVAEQAGRAVAGRREAAQRVAGRDHAGHGVHAVARDVPDHQQQLLGGQQHAVVPVAANQPAWLHRAVPDRELDPHGHGRLVARRHDGLLQADGDPVLLSGPLLTVRELVPGGGEGHLGVVVR